MSKASWDQKIAAFYDTDFDESDALGTIEKMRALVAERPGGDADALFELAGVHDSLGLESDAIPLYRAAIEAGLDGERATRVYIQLASSLRNVGETAEAVSMLESAPDAGIDEPAKQAFLALALFSEGRCGDALKTALLALIPTLDGYQRSLTDYANDLPSDHPTER